MSSIHESQSIVDVDRHSPQTIGATASSSSAITRLVAPVPVYADGRSRRSAIDYLTSPHSPDSGPGADAFNQFFDMTGDGVFEPTDSPTDSPTGSGCLITDPTHEVMEQLQAYWQHQQGIVTVQPCTDDDHQCVDDTHPEPVAPPPAAIQTPEPQPIIRSLRDFVLERINNREQRTISELSCLNQQIRQMRSQKSYPLHMDDLLSHIDADNQIEPPTEDLFARLDAATGAERAAFVSKLLSENQLNHILMYYEMTHIIPHHRQPFNETAIITKAQELLHRYRWIVGGIYIDDDVWTVHRSDTERSNSSFALSTTVSRTASLNDDLERYLDRLCTCIERYFVDLSVRYQNRSISDTNRNQLFIKFNTVQIAETCNHQFDSDCESGSDDDDNDSDSDYIEYESDDDTHGNDHPDAQTYTGTDALTSVQ